MASPILRPLSLGEILDVSFSLYRNAFGPLVVIAVVTSGLPQIVSVYLDAAGGPLENPLFWLGNSLLGLMLGTIGVGATTFIISERYLGRSIPAGAAFGRATPYFGRLLVLSILAGLAIMVGALLLVVPGLIIASGVLLAVPALVLESLPSGGRALSRSWELTRGLRAKGFLTVCVAILLLVIPTVAIGFIAAMFGGAGAEAGETSPALTAAAVVLATIISPYVYVVITVLYYDARVRKEAFDLEMLAAEMQQD
jgi:hypothetical protein